MNFGLALVLLWRGVAAASTETLTDVRLRACGLRGDICVEVVTTEARRSPVDTAFAFRSARVTVLAAGPTPARHLDVRSGYYDPTTGYLVMHGRPGGLINLNTGRLTLIDDSALDVQRAGAGGPNSPKAKGGGSRTGGASKPGNSCGNSTWANCSHSS